MMPTVKHPVGFPPCISLTIGFNEHANYYQTVAEWLNEQEDRVSWVSPEERQRAIENDSVWVCQWYPHTPVGFNIVAASTFEALMAAVNNTAASPPAPPRGHA